MVEGRVVIVALCPIPRKCGDLLEEEDAETETEAEFE